MMNPTPQIKRGPPRDLLAGMPRVSSPPARRPETHRAKPRRKGRRKQPGKRISLSTYTRNENPKDDDWIAFLVAALLGAFIVFGIALAGI